MTLILDHSFKINVDFRWTALKFKKSNSMGLGTGNLGWDTSSSFSG